MPPAARYAGAEPNETEDLPPGWSRRPVAALPPADPASAEPSAPPAASDRPPIPPVSDREPPPSRGTPPRHGGGAAVLAVAGLLIAAALGLYLARAEVVARWPEAASLYARLGLEVEAAGPAPAAAEGATAAIAAEEAPPPAGPTIEDVRSRLLADGGVRQLLVSGRIANPSDRPVPLPDIRVTLLAEDGRDLGSRIVDLTGEALGAGEVRPFETAVDDPPAEARSLSLTVIGGGEEDEGAAIDG